MSRLADDPVRDQQLARLRSTHPVFRIEGASSAFDDGTLRLTFQLASGGSLHTPYFTDPTLAPLYQAMAGLAGDKPFECTGTEDEVRSAIHAAGQHGGNQPTLIPCLRDPAITAARPLDVLLKDWGQDDLMSPALRNRVRRAASL